MGRSCSVGRRGRETETREHILLGAPGRSSGAGRVHEQGRHGPLIRQLLDLVELEVRELLSKYNFPGDTISVIRGWR